MYAIYYTGDFKLYRPIAHRNLGNRFEQPIYVGKAVPKGGRKGGLGYDAASGAALRERLKQHATSVDQSQNLRLADFHFRALTVDDIWIPLGENVLIEKFQPLWNRVIDGFGNKDPGNRRATQYRSSWDVLHPGRAFVDKLAENPLTVAQIRQRIKDFLRGAPFDEDQQQVREEPSEDG